MAKKGGFKPKLEYVREARKLIGKKAILTGGGMSRQYAYIVKVKGVSRDGHANLEIRGWSFPWTKLETFKPLLMSWRLQPLNKAYGRLPLGRYDMIAGVRDQPRKPLVRIAKRKR